MAKILITGAAGMVGSHLFESLRGMGDEIVGTYFRPTVDIAEIDGGDRLVELDVRYRGEVERALRVATPDVVYHLAAQSLPVKSWSNPEDTIDANIMGTVNVFESIKAIRRDDPSYDPVVVVACSSAEYGASLTPENVPIREDTILLPLHPYGVSKVGQDLLTYQYWVNDRIRGIRARIFNTTGPRKTNDVVSDLAHRTAALRATGGRDLRVGNLDTRRAILDYRDLISALIALAERGAPGDVYNICSEQLFQIRDIVALFSKLAGIELTPVVDPALLRPSDEPVIFGDRSKLCVQTGWVQKYDLEKTVGAVLDYEVRRLERSTVPRGG